MRLQLELSEERVKELKMLIDETDSGTYKGLIDNALSLFEWVVKEVKGGLSIAAVDEKNRSYRVLVMPALDRVASRAQAIKGAQTPAAART